MNRALLLTLTSSLLLLCFSFNRACGFDLFSGQIMAAPECVQNTWTFLYTDIRFEEIIRTYEATPTFIITTADLSSDKIDLSSVNRPTYMLKLDVSDIRKLLAGPSVVSQVRKAKLKELIRLFKESTGNSEYLLVPRNTPAKVLQALNDEKVKVIYQPISVMDYTADLATFPLEGMIIVDLSTSGFELIVNLGKHLESIGKSAYTLKECVGLAAINPSNTTTTMSLDTKLAKLKRVINESEVSYRWYINRSVVIEDSEIRWGSTDKRTFLGRFKIHFIGEDGVDFSGPYYDWVSEVAVQGFGLNSKYFDTNADNDNLLTPKTQVMPELVLSRYEFLGSFVGKAILNGRPVGATFPKFLLKLMLGRQPNFHDLEKDFSVEFASLKRISEMTVNERDALFTFSTTRNNIDGTTLDVNLTYNGSNIVGNENNKYEYMGLRFKFLVDTPQIQRFVKGFREIVALKFNIDIFKPEELSSLIRGPKEIDIQDWMRNTQYWAGYHANARQVQWFWNMVESFTHEERSKLLRWATGKTQPPLQGFAFLQGSNGIDMFTIDWISGGDNAYPLSHTCFNRIDIPTYSSEAILRQQFSVALNLNEGFGRR